MWNRAVDRYTALGWSSVGCSTWYECVCLWIILIFSTIYFMNREINSTSCERQQTPLHIVMGDNNTTLIKLLLNCGASPDVGDEKGNTPLHYATEPQFNYLIPVSPFT